MGLPLSPQVFAIMSSLIEERTGIRHEPRDLDLLAEKLSQRAIERGFDSLLDYYYCLRYDEDAERELKALIETLVVQETYFFREAEALGVLIDLVIPQTLARPDRPDGPVRVWSAACATGEEPLTLAMMLDQRGLLDRVEIVATDISTRGLDRARQGVYGGRSLRAISDAMRAQYMSDQPGGRVQVRRDLRERIDWRQLNLIDAEAIAALGLFDAIVCRNVMIYFADAGCQRLVGLLAEALRPEGVLLVGASESLLRFGVFECVERAGTFLYRRPTP